MRREFSKSVKTAAWKRAGGRCEKCTAKLFPGKYEYHHTQEDTFGGDPTIENCALLCKACHGKITGERAGVIAKNNRIRNNHIGIKRNVKPLPGSRASEWKHKLDGSWVRRSGRNIRIVSFGGREMGTFGGKGQDD